MTQGYDSVTATCHYPPPYLPPNKDLGLICTLKFHKIVWICFQKTLLSAWMAELPHEAHMLWLQEEILTFGLA